MLTVLTKHDAHSTLSIHVRLDISSKIPSSTYASRANDMLSLIAVRQHLSFDPHGTVTQIRSRSTLPNSVKRPKG